MKQWTLFALIAGLVLAVSGAWAATPPVVIDYKTGNIISGDAAFSTGWFANKDGTEWWDNNSQDAQVNTSFPSGHTELNIGGVLVGGEADPNTPYNPKKISNPPGVIPFLHENSGGVGKSVTDWIFQDGSSVVVLKLEFAGYRDINEFGIYKPGSTNASDRIKLFDGTDNPGKKASFGVPTGWNGQFGLYAVTPQGTFYSQASLNSADVEQLDPNKTRPYQHFALFKGKLNQYGFVQWWIGVEDKTWANNGGENNDSNTNRGDYQDMVLTLEAVPDASTFALFLSGLPVLALLRRRK